MTEEDCEKGCWQHKDAPAESNSSEFLEFFQGFFVESNKSFGVESNKHARYQYEQSAPLP